MNDNIIHVGAIKLRLVGSGNLVPTLIALDAATKKVLVSIPMSTININEPVRLCNFVSQKAVLRLETNMLNENFTINKIMIFIKPIYSSVPNVS